MEVEQWVYLVLTVKECEDVLRKLFLSDQEGVTFPETILKQTGCIQRFEFWSLSLWKLNPDLQ